MTMNIRRLTPVLTWTAGALMAAAFLSSAVAHADVTYEYIVPNTVSDPLTITSVGGIAPFDTEVSEFGFFDVNGSGTFGNAMFYSDIFGLHNELLEGEIEGTPRSIFDDLFVGSGLENVYTDLVGQGPDGSNLITDTLITPFGDFTIPTTFDAAALDFGAPTAAAALDTDFTGFAAALDADWTPLVTDFGALF